MMVRSVFNTTTLVRWENTIFRFLIVSISLLLIRLRLTAPPRPLQGGVGKATKTKTCLWLTFLFWQSFSLFVSTKIITLVRTTFFQTTSPITLIEIICPIMLGCSKRITTCKILLCAFVIWHIRLPRRKTGTKGYGLFKFFVALAIITCTCWGRNKHDNSKIKDRK